MFIESIKISNFKSFNEIELGLQQFNVVIGANASGKSNFVSLFTFIKDIFIFGLDNAISYQGGLDYLCPIKTETKNLHIELLFNMEKDDTILYHSPKKEFGISIKKMQYILHLDLKRNNYKIEYEKLVNNCNFYELKFENEKLKKRTKIFNGDIIFNNEAGKFDYYITGGSTINVNDIIPKFQYVEKMKTRKRLSKKSFIENLYLYLPFSLLLSTFFKDITIYDFAPKEAKKATPISGKIDLESDGNNLALILNNIKKNDKKYLKLMDLTKNILPFIDQMEVIPLANKSLLMNITESYAKDKSFPGPLISDGTINIISFVIILFFENKPFIIFEEPEKSIHPFLISKIIKMMIDVSNKKRKQIILTTHNPEIVKYSGLENILFIYRDEYGHSQISKLKDADNIKLFTENMGVEELFIQNLLE